LAGGKHEACVEREWFASSGKDHVKEEDTSEASCAAERKKEAGG